MAHTIDEIKKIRNGRGTSAASSSDSTKTRSTGHSIEEIRRLGGRNVYTDSEGYTPSKAAVSAPISQTRPEYRYNSIEEYDNALEKIKPKTDFAKRALNAGINVLNGIGGIGFANTAATPIKNIPYTEEELAYNDLKTERNLYAQEHAFDQYKKYQNNADYAKKSQESIEDYLKILDSNNTDQTYSRVYNAMTDEEKAMANYLASNNINMSLEESNRFKDYMMNMRSMVDKRSYNQKVADANKYIDNGGSRIGLSAKTVGENLVSSIGTGGEYVASYLGGWTPNPYGGASGLGNLAMEEREAVSKDMGKAGSFLYNTGMSVADSALGAYLFGEGYATLMGTNAFNTTYKDLYEKGASQNEILLGALSAGAAETIFERISLEKLLEPKSITAWHELISETLKQAGVEASEETFTELANIFSDEFINGPNSEVGIRIRELKAQGMSDDEIAKTIERELQTRIIEAAAGGALSGGMMSGLFNGSQFRQNRRIGSNVDRQEFKDSLDTETQHDLEEKYGENWADEVSDARMGAIYKDVVSKASEEAFKIDKDINVSDTTTLNGEEAKLTGFTKIGDRVVLNTDKGRADLKDIKLSTNDAQIVTIAKGLKDDRLANAFVKNYGGEDIADYDMYTRYLYEAGKVNADWTENVDVTDKVMSTLGKDKANAIYEAGQMSDVQDLKFLKTAYDVAVSEMKSQNIKKGDFAGGSFDADGNFVKDDDFYRNLSRTKKRIYLLCKAFADFAGVNVQVINDDNVASENGHFVVDRPDGGTVMINLAARPYGDSAYGMHSYVIDTLSHELTHWMRGNNEEGYTILEKAISEHLKSKGVYDDLIKNEIESHEKTHPGEKFSEADALEEVVARGCEDMLDDPKTMREVLSTLDVNSLEKLRVAFDKWFERIETFIDKLMSGFESPNETIKYLRDEYNTFRKLWVEGIQGAIKNAQNMDATSNDSAMFSVKMTKDGIEEYEISEPVKQMSYAQRLKEVKALIASDYIGKKVRFKRNGHEYEAEFGNVGLNKNFYGDRDSSKRGFKAKVSIAAEGDFIELVEYAKYESSLKEKVGKTGKAHKNSNYWDYYVKTIKYNDRYYDVLINVQETSVKDHYIYNIVLKEALTLQDHLRSSKGNVKAPKEMVTYDGYVVKKPVKQMNSDKLTDERQQNSLNKVLNKVGVEVEDGYAYPKYSLKTWRSSEYSQDAETAAKALAKSMEISVEEAKQYIKDVGSIASQIANDQDRLDYVAIEGKSAWVSNPEYGGSLDYSFLCPKRLTYTGTMNAILAKQNDLIFSVDDFLYLRKALIAAGYEAPCSFCFVESARARFGKYNAQFIDLAKEEKLDYIPTAEDLSNPNKLEEMRSEHPETFKRYEKFLNSLSQRKPKMLEERRPYNGDILKAFQGKEHTIIEKNLHGGIRFNSFSDFETVHMLDCMQAIMDMSRVGLAGFGYAKQKAFAQIFGKTGLKINMSCVAKGVMQDGKHVIFDDIEGMNHKDALKLRNGNVGIVCVVFTDDQVRAALCDERIDYVLPFHRSQWSKKDYEKMGLSLDTKDYTRLQTEKLGTKKAKEGNIPFLSYWNESQTGEETVQRYLDIINEQNKTPIFPFILEKDEKGNWIMPKGKRDRNGNFLNKKEEIKELAAKNYWKLLTEYKMYENDGTPIGQYPVKPIFDMDAANELLKKYDGSHKEFPVSEEVVEDFMNYKKTGESKLLPEWKKYSDKLSTISLTDEDYQTLKEYFGTTNDFNVAGYMLKDGTMLDFSGKHWGNTTSKTRDVDHRDIAEAEMFSDISGYEAMVSMISDGNIRLTPEVGGINLSRIPTKEQEAMLRKYIAWWQRNNNRDFNVDIDNADGDTIQTFTFDKNDSADKVMNTIKSWFNGNTMSDVARFHTMYSDKLDSVYMEAVEKGDLTLAQEMVDQAAKNAGYTIKGYHGTEDYGFKVFDPNKSDDRISLFFTTNKGMANTYVGDESKIYETYLKVTNPYVVDAHGSKWNEIYLDEDMNKLPKEVRAIYEYGTFIRKNVDSNVDYTYVFDQLGEAEESARYLIEEAKENGSPYSKEREEEFIRLAQEVDKIYEEWDEDEHLDEDGYPQSLEDYVYDHKISQTSTRKLAKYAKENGYDGLIVKNVMDNGKHYQDIGTLYESEVVVVFDSNQVKSADAVTYDDNGNIIPLSERFDSNQKDIRYSDKLDSTGKELTERQRNYFINSKVRDAQGRLLVVYHGTSEEFDIFKPNDFIKERNGISKIVGYFSEDRSYAEIYGDVTPYYLNIENPLVFDGTEKTLDEWRAFLEANGVTDVIFDSSVTGENGQIDTLKGGNYPDGTKYVFYELLDMSNYWYGDGNLTERIQAAGYDGIQSGDEYEKAWMPFNQDAPKRIDNLNPTHDASTRNSEKLDLTNATPEVKERVKELEKQVGKLTKENDALKAAKAMAAEKAQKEALTSKIIEQSKTLSKWLLTDPKANPVPQALRKPIINLLRSIDYTTSSYAWRKAHENEYTKKDQSMAVMMGRINHMLHDIDQDMVDDPEAYDMSQLDWLPAFNKEFEQITNAISEAEKASGEKFNLQQMSVEDLDTLNKLIGALKTSVHNMNKVYGEHNKESVSDLGKEMIDYLDKVGLKNVDNALTQFMEIDNTTPYYFFKRLGPSGQKLFRILMDAQGEYAFKAQEIEEYAKDVFKGKDVIKWREIVKEFDITEVKYGKSNIATTEEKHIKMTVPQIMSLYCLAKRDQALRHISSGGIKIATFKEGKNEVRQLDNVTLSESDLKMIVGTLTDEQIEVADKLQEFLSTTCSKWGNEVTMQRFGYKAYTEKNYFPINVDQNVLTKEARQRGSSLYQLLNMGFTKPLNPKARNPIEIFDIFETFTIHSTDMAQYNAFALPILNVIRVWNYKEVENLDTEQSDWTATKENVERDTGEEAEVVRQKYITVKGSIEKAIGKKGNHYIGTLLADLNGDVTHGRADFLDKFSKNYKTAAVAANMQVVLLQPMSYIRAGYAIDNKYLVKAVAMKSDPELIMKYCGMAVWKEMGFYNLAINNGLAHKIMQDDSTKDKLIDKTLWLAGKMDELTWRKLWNACELETRDKTKLEVGSEEYYKAVGERLTDLIFGTQVVDSVLTKSELMRGTDTYTKMLTAFNAEPTLGLNIVMDAAEMFDQDRRANGTQHALRTQGANMRKAASVYLAGSLAESILRAVWGRIRNYDGEEDDETLLHEILTRFLEELNPLRKIPYVKDIYGMLIQTIAVFKGDQFRIYADTRMDEASIEALANAIGQIPKVIEKQEITYKDINKIAKGIDATGLPVSNTMRIFKGIWNNTIGRIWESALIK